MLATSRDLGKAAVSDSFFRQCPWSESRPWRQKKISRLVWALQAMARAAAGMAGSAARNGGGWAGCNARPSLGTWRNRGRDAG